MSAAIVRSDAGEPVRERHRFRPGLRRGGQDAEVEQDPVGEAEPGLVVPPAVPGALLAFPAGGGELVQVSDGQLVKAAAGLDQQPGRDLRCVRGPDPLAEPELRRGLQDTGKVLAQRGSLKFPPEAGESCVLAGSRSRAADARGA